MSANDDTDPISAQDAFGGWPGIDLGGETETPPAEEPSDGAPEVVVPEEGAPAEHGPADGDGTPPAEPEVPEWKKYGFKDENAMWTSYKELQRAFHARNQPAAEEEEEEDEPASPSWKSHEFAALGEIPQVGLSAAQRTQLADLMQLDPKAAALWAYQNQEHMEATDFKAVQNHFAANDPEEYWEIKNAIQQYRQQQQYEETNASQQEWVLTQQRESAINEAKAAMGPVMEERAVEFGEWLEQPENKAVSDLIDSYRDPATLKQGLISAFYQFAGPSIFQELQTSQASAQAAAAAQAAADAAAAEAAAAKGKGARTQTRTAPGGGSNGATDDAADAIRALIANPHGL